MSDEHRTYIRQRDYYGGSIWIEPADDGLEGDIDIEWSAWGDYGFTVLRLRINEAKELADALMRWYNSVDDWAKE